jgi:hypothetical protein
MISIFLLRVLSAFRGIGTFTPSAPPPAIPPDVVTYLGEPVTHLGEYVTYNP